MKIVFGAEYSPINYLQNNNTTRRSLESVLNRKIKESWVGSTYMTDSGRLNYNAESPIYIGHYTQDFQIELGCDFDYDVGGSYD